MTDSLISRIEAAGEGEQRELLIEAFTALFSDPLGYIGNRTDDQRRIAFLRRLDANAFESAAMMLVPEGWESTVWSKGEAYLHSPKRPEIPDVGAFAATPALALAAACLKAHAHQEKEG
jgi:hypothetical protein